LRIVLIENFRAVFYTPFYAAASLGAFDAEGLDVEIRMSPDPEKTLQQLGADEATVSWGGPMRLLREHDRDPASAAVAFCEAIGKDPFFLIGRNPNPTYQPRDLVGTRLAVVSEVPTPWICLQQDLRLAGLNPSVLTLAPARTMQQNADALQAGDVDVVQVFQPYAHELLQSGAGHLWYAAASRGFATYTTLNTPRGFLARHADVALRMTRAMYRTLDWIHRRDDASLARAVAAWFPSISEPTLAACCAGYKTLGVWNRTPVMQRAGFDWLRDAMRASGDIAREVDFGECVDMRFAEAVLRETIVPL